MEQHTYTFEDTVVDPEGLLPSTIRALETYDKEYEADKLGYFDSLLGTTGTVRTHYANKVPYALTGGHDDSAYSKREAVLWQNPWATPITPHKSTALEYVALADGRAERPEGFDTNRIGKLVMADLAQAAMKEAGIRDEDGLPLPVIAVSSPSKDWHLKRHEGAPKHAILGELAGHAMGVAHKLEFKTVHLAGTSLGGAVMGEALREAGTWSPSKIVPMRSRQGVNIGSALLSETPSYVKRGLIDFGTSYAFDTRGLGIKGAWTDQGPLSRRELAADGLEAYDGPGNAAGNGNLRANSSLVNQMRRDRLSYVLEIVKSYGVPVTFEAGVASKVGRGIFEYLDRHEMSNGSNPFDLDGAQLLRAEGMAPHAHTENPVYMADAITRSVLFAKETAKAA